MMKFGNDKPCEPLPNECCGSGCVPCVYDVFSRRLKQWEEKWSISNTVISSSLGLSRDEFVKAKVIDIEKLTGDCLVIKITCVANHADTKCQMKHVVQQDGRHFQIRMVDDGGDFVLRPYTPVIIPSEDSNNDNCCHFLVKTYPNGKMSSLWQQIKPGDKFDIRGPWGGCVTFQCTAFDHVVFLAAGSGLAPCYQMIQSVLNREDAHTVVHLLYTVKKASEIFLKAVLDDYSDYWNFTVEYFITQQQEDLEDGQMRYNDKFYLQRIDEKALERAVVTLDKTQIVICGTNEFSSAMVTKYSSLGIDSKYIYTFDNL